MWTIEKNTYTFPESLEYDGDRDITRSRVFRNSNQNLKNTWSTWDERKREDHPD